jgi:hypothetical protein
MTLSNPNIALEYLYRDSGNNKSYGAAVFSNNSALSLAEIEKRLEVLWVSPDKNFEAEMWGLPTLYFAEGDEELDHGWHEFASLSFTDEAATQGDITEFLVTSPKKSSHSPSPNPPIS